MIENCDLKLQIAEQASDLYRRLGIVYVFKASFGKANRNSVTSFCGTCS